MRRDTVRALEIADEQAGIRAMSRGELEGQILQGERAQATAPRDVSSRRRLTWQAGADAWQQSADAEAEHDEVQADNVGSLATAIAAEISRLEAANERYGEWSARTASTPPSITASRGLRNGSRKPGTRKRIPLHPGANRSSSSPGMEYQRTREPESEGSRPGTPEPEAAGPIPADHGRAARLDELQARVDEAARRINAQQAELNASSEHTARTERETQAEPEADWQAETSHDMEMELQKIRPRWHRGR